MNPTLLINMMLDIGANPDSTPENLAQYARMGAVFSERVLGVPRPRVALLSIGEERGKGDQRIARATELLDATDLNFVGNVEGKDLTHQLADVVVCDAVLGNVVIIFMPVHKKICSVVVIEQVDGINDGDTCIQTGNSRQATLLENSSHFLVLFFLLRIILNLILQLLCHLGVHVRELF